MPRHEQPTVRMQPLERANHRRCAGAGNCAVANTALRQVYRGSRQGVTMACSVDSALVLFTPPLTTYY
jgi:hypothetical protein